MNTILRFLLWMLVSCNVIALEPDWENYNDILRSHTQAGVIDGVNLTLVDYPGLINNEQFAQLISQVENFSISQLESKAEKLAFYINVYNILAIKVVLDHWPVESIKDAGSIFSSVWKKDAGKIDHHEVTLDYLEHAILRKFNEPRIHMAIVCASVSCPDLRREPYTSQVLESQLEDQTKKFLGNTGKGLKITARGIEVSKIFDWFDTDFSQFGGVEKFIQQYQPELINGGQISGYLPYNWKLNKK